MSNAATKEPIDIPAERAVLGACLLDPQAVYAARELGLLPEHFYDKPHREVYTAIVRLADANKPADTVQLYSELSGIIANPANVLGELSAAVPTATRIDDYARNVLDAYARREIISACRTAALIAQKETGAQESAVRLIASMERICGARMRSVIESPAQLLSALQERIAASGPTAAGYYSGIYDLDNVVKGIRPKQLWVIGGRPSAGKTAFLLTLVSYMCPTYGPALISSLDATKEEVMDRLIRIVIPHDEFRDVWGPRDREGLAALCNIYADRLRSMPVYIDDTTCHIEDMIYTWRAHVARHSETKWIGVDYFQQIQTRQRFRQRLDSLNYVLARMKSFRLETGIPIILLSQLNRQDWPAGQGPGLHHLKDTGTLEQDANVVMLLSHLDPKVHHMDGLLGDPMQLNIAKQKDGPTRKIVLKFVKPQFLFLSPSNPREDRPEQTQLEGTEEPDDVPF